MLPFVDAADVRSRRPVLAAVDALEAALRDGLDPDADVPRTVLDAAAGSLLRMPSAAAMHPVVKLWPFVAPALRPAQARDV